MKSFRSLERPTPAGYAQVRAAANRGRHGGSRVIRSVTPGGPVRGARSSGGGGSGSVLKRILNCPERITYHRLSEVCARHSAQVYVKVRLADVLPVEASGVSEGLYQFALQAHYDFVITDLAQNPLFAVEFDGPGHTYPAQVERDAKKDELSRRFRLPLLRVLGDDLHRTAWQLDRLTGLTERWFDGSAFESGDRRAGENGPTASPFARGNDVAGKPSCPVCGSGMVEKNGKYGPFLSCAHFPNCRGSCDLPGPLAPSDPQAGRVHGPTGNPFPRPWLIAGFVLVGLTFMALVIVIARSLTDRARVTEPSQASESPSISEPARIATSYDPATPRQRKFLGLLIRRRGWDTAERDAAMGRVLGYNCKYSELSKQEASRLITAWDDRGK